MRTAFRAILFAIFGLVGSLYADEVIPTGALKLAVAGKFEFLADKVESIAEHQGSRAERYWIVRLMPLHPGTYTVNHDRENAVKYGGYGRLEHTYTISVAPTGTVRDLLCYGVDGRSCPIVCLGDAIVLMFDVSPHFSKHTFTVQHKPAFIKSAGPNLPKTVAQADPFERPSAAAKTPTSPPGTAKTKVPPSGLTEALSANRFENEASQFLKAVGIDEGGMRAVNGAWYPDFTVSFEAVTTAKSLLKVSYSSQWQTVPIVIVPPNTKLNVFITHVLAREYDLDGSASIGRRVLRKKDLVVLRIGDFIRFQLPGNLDGSDTIKCEPLPFDPSRFFSQEAAPWKEF